MVVGVHNVEITFTVKCYVIGDKQLILLDHCVTGCHGGAEELVAAGMRLKPHSLLLRGTRPPLILHCPTQTRSYGYSRQFIRRN